MKNISRLILSIVFIFTLILSRLFLPNLYAQDIKEPNVAGTFYPDDPGQLSTMIGGFLEKANPQSPNGRIFALISPHAGYGFSGAVAAFGYKLIKDKPYKTVIVLGTSHHYPFNGASVYPRGLFKTPLGLIEVDNEFSAKLLGRDPEIVFAPEAFKEEHSVEVELPFLQKTLVDFKIVPIVFGDCTLVTCKKIAGLLKEAIGERKDILVIASSDMYHGYDYDEADAVDNFTLKAIKDMDSEALYYGLREGKMQACGGFGVVTALILAKDLGHDKVAVLRHTNSAEVTAKKTKGIWTVGYASCAIDASTKLSVNGEPGRTIDQPKASPIQAGREKNMLNNIQRKRLLEIARSSIETYLKTGKSLQVDETEPLFLKNMGAFVTLNEAGELRGCIGNLIGTEALYLTVRDMAVQAATGDPRFSPLELSELKNISIEISVLSPMEKIDNPDKIELGKHGVLVRQGYRSGVFLPHVATETGWSKDEFMSNLCAHKAGLPADAWKDRSTEIYIFTAEVFSEKN